DEPATGGRPRRSPSGDHPGPIPALDRVGAVPELAEQRPGVLAPVRDRAQPGLDADLAEPLSEKDGKELSRILGILAAEAGLPR
ncbi:hypothetical protein, partial [Nonomuraea sp. NPDC049784]|uniref:hypothetical protein n=1 Tax=Nonomuraea sp. NPDC049784 TaxID=3154361 RepID=UPI0033FD8066